MQVTNKVRVVVLQINSSCAVSPDIINTVTGQN